MSSHDRENLVIGAKFMRDDLPYFVELLAEVASMTKYQSKWTRFDVYLEVLISFPRPRFCRGSSTSNPIIAKEVPLEYR